MGASQVISNRAPQIRFGFANWDEPEKGRDIQYLDEKKNSPPLRYVEDVRFCG